MQVIHDTNCSGIAEQSGDAWRLTPSSRHLGGLPCLLNASLEGVGDVQCNCRYSLTLVIGQLWHPHHAIGEGFVDRLWDHERAKRLMQ